MTTDPRWDASDTDARLHAQDRRIDALSRHLETITDAITERTNETTLTAGRWEDLPPDQARHRWQQLRAWVDWLRHRYALDPKTLPWCWYLHGALIEEVGALWAAHHAAHTLDPDPTSPAAWHDTLARTLPRLREWSGRTGCKPREYHDDITTDPGEPHGRWENHLTLGHQER